LFKINNILRIHQTDVDLTEYTAIALNLFSFKPC